MFICVLVFYYWKSDSTVKSITEAFEIVQLDVRLQNRCVNKRYPRDY